MRFLLGDFVGYPPARRRETTISKIAMANTPMPVDMELARRKPSSQGRFVPVFGLRE